MQNAHRGKWRCTEAREWFRRFWFFFRRRSACQTRIYRTQQTLAHWHMHTHTEWTWRHLPSRERREMQLFTPLSRLSTIRKDTRRTCDVIVPTHFKAPTGWTFNVSLKWPPAITDTYFARGHGNSSQFWVGRTGKSKKTGEVVMRRALAAWRQPAILIHSQMSLNFALSTFRLKFAHPSC